jgi:hypothetical protein
MWKSDKIFGFGGRIMGRKRGNVGLYSHAEGRGCYYAPAVYDMSASAAIERPLIYCR